MVIVGGIDMMTQSLQLAKKPHIIIGTAFMQWFSITEVMVLTGFKTISATPGRLVDHLENTKGFNLRSLKYLVMDEADRILNMDFEAEVDKILKVIPRERRTYLYSATMTKKVQKLQRASLRDPVRVEVSSKYQTVDKLQQFYLFIPSKFKVEKVPQNVALWELSGHLLGSHTERTGGKQLHGVLLHLCRNAASRGDASESRARRHPAARADVAGGDKYCDICVNT